MTVRDLLARLRSAQCIATVAACAVAAGVPAHAAEDPYGENAEGGGTLPQLEFDTWASQIFWLLLTFGGLYYVLSRVALPRISGVIEDRHDTIADDLDEAARLQRQAEAAKATYEQTLADARARAHTIAAETRAQMDAQIAEEIARADAEAAERAEEAETRIRAAAEQAMAQAEAIAGEAAASVIERLTGATPSAELTSLAVRAAIESEKR